MVLRHGAQYQLHILLITILSFTHTYPPDLQFWQSLWDKNHSWSTSYLSMCPQTAHVNEYAWIAPLFAQSIILLYPTQATALGAWWHISHDFPWNLELIFSSFPFFTQALFGLSALKPKSISICVFFGFKFCLTARKRAHSIASNEWK